MIAWCHRSGVSGHRFRSCHSRAGMTEGGKTANWKLHSAFHVGESLWARSWFHMERDRTWHGRPARESWPGRPCHIDRGAKPLTWAHAVRPYRRGGASRAQHAAPLHGNCLLPFMWESPGHDYNIMGGRPFSFSPLRGGLRGGLSLPDVQGSLFKGSKDNCQRLTAYCLLPSVPWFPRPH